MFVILSMRILERISDTIISIGLIIGVIMWLFTIIKKKVARKDTSNDNGEPSDTLSEKIEGRDAVVECVNSIIEQAQPGEKIWIQSVVGRLFKHLDKKIIYEAAERGVIFEIILNKDSSSKMAKFFGNLKETTIVKDNTSLRYIGLSNEIFLEIDLNDEGYSAILSRNEAKINHWRKVFYEKFENCKNNG